jgi:hypothetical protein
VAGCEALRDELEQLELLERLGRLQPDEQRRLQDYRRLGNQILVLPGFEFTATLGFHVLGIFPPDTPLRQLEYLLLELHVPPERLDEGSTEVGATSDVLTAYRVIDEAGGLAIAAHANSTHGVALRGLGFGGQTRIAYTQDPHLHALEVTDLEKKGRNTTAYFFSGRKPEYPRRMHCIQGSDAHRLTADPRDKNRLGVGDRITEFLLPEASFEALKALFLGDDFSRTRPYRPTRAPYDHVQSAREEGSSIVQSFHESMTKRGGRQHAVLRDIVAFANTNGGTIYIGAKADPKAPPAGVPDSDEAIAQIKSAIQRKITPPLDVRINVLESKGRKVLQLIVPRGDDPPYAIDGTNIYLRQETDTSIAMRDEIVSLVQRTLSAPEAPGEEPAAEAEEPQDRIDAPRTGVQIVDEVERKGTTYYSMKDLRNGNVVRNVSRSSARKLWQYAITQHETNPVNPAQVEWKGNLGLWKASKRAGKVRYDLVQRQPDGSLAVYYGVTDDGIHDAWRTLIEETR